MADNTNYGVPIGSGRVRLPARLSLANFAASVAAAITSAPAVQLKSYTTAARNTLGGTFGANDKGKMVWDDDLDAVVVWDGTAWKTPDGGTPA